MDSGSDRLIKTGTFVFLYVIKVILDWSPKTFKALHAEVVHTYYQTDNQGVLFCYFNGGYCIRDSQFYLIEKIPELKTMFLNLEKP